MTKEMKEKIKEFSELIKQYPYIKEFYIYRASLYEKSKQYQKAIEDYKTIIPEQYICFNMADICERNGLIKEAERYYTQEINKDKRNIRKYLRRIYFYIRTKEIEKAISDCKKVLELSSKNETVSILKKILTEKI